MIVPVAVKWYWWGGTKVCTIPGVYWPEGQVYHCHRCLWAWLFIGLMWCLRFYQAQPVTLQLPVKTRRHLANPNRLSLSPTRPPRHDKKMVNMKKNLHKSCRTVRHIEIASTGYRKCTVYLPVEYDHLNGLWCSFPWENLHNDICRMFYFWSR